MSADQDTGRPGRESGGLLDAQGVAEMLDVPKTWVEREARANRIPHVRIGRYRRFRREAVEAWLGSREQGPR